MKTVWKFILPVEDAFALALPVGAEILHVEVQHDTPCLWALCDPDADKEDRHFVTAGTGHPLSDDARLHHVGSYMLAGGRFVGHLFEGIR